MAGGECASDWNLTIFIPDTAVVGEQEEVEPGPHSKLHAKGPLLGWFSGEEKVVNAEKAEAQWTETIKGIVSAVGEWSEATAGQWKIDEVNFGLTLNAEGKLMFLAKAGAQASVQVKVKQNLVVVYATRVLA